MTKYIVNINVPTIELDVLGRKTLFKKNEEVSGNTYTKCYPQYFKKIGEVKGYNINLATPTFIPDIIQEFAEKEKERRPKTKKVKVQDIEPLVPIVQEKTQVQELEELFEELVEEFDIKIETEEE
jgi:hypothetical protein